MTLQESKDWGFEDLTSARPSSDELLGIFDEDEEDLS